MIYRVFLVAFLLSIGIGSTHAQRWNISPFAGYRFGGTLENNTTGNNVKFADNPSYGIEVNWDPLDSGLKLAVLYSHQDTDAVFQSLAPVTRVRTEVDQIMVGAIQELYDDKFRPFVAGYVGATSFRPSGYDSELQFAFGLGVGMNYYITDYFGVRLDLRGYGTVVDSDAGFFCVNGACIANWSGEIMWQGEAAASVFISF